MWVFTKIGYFSAVQSDVNKDEVTVRARVKDDLVALNKLRVQEDLPTLEILQLANRDYPYRVVMAKSEWGVIMAELSTGIDYTNFKDSIKKIEPARASLYSRVWSTMLHAESDLGKRAENRSVYGRATDHDFSDDWRATLPGRQSKSKKA